MSTRAKRGDRKHHNAFARDAKSAAAIDIGICQYCRKCLRRSYFLDSRFQSITRVRRHHASPALPESALREP
jgi:hypothetical protein